MLLVSPTALCSGMEFPNTKRGIVFQILQTEISRFGIWLIIGFALQTFYDTERCFALAFGCGVIFMAEAKQSSLITPIEVGPRRE